MGGRRPRLDREPGARRGEQALERRDRRRLVSALIGRDRGLRGACSSGERGLAEAGPLTRAPQRGGDVHRTRLYPLGYSITDRVLGDGPGLPACTSAPG